MLRWLTVALVGTIAQSPQRAPVMTKMIATDNATWVIDDHGSLHRWTDTALIREPFDGKVVDIARSGTGHLVVLRARQERLPSLVELGADGIWRAFGDVQPWRPDEYFALSIVGERAAILARGTILVVKRDGVASRRSYRGATINREVVPSFAMINDSIAYIGRNKGEFGGGLIRINTRSGLAMVVVKRDSKELCAGPLNPQCDAVTAVVPDVTDDRCAIAAIGLVHFTLQNGRILRVCGDSISVLAERPCHPQDGQPVQPLAMCSEGVFALARSGDGFWAVTGSAILRFRGVRQSGEFSMPTSGVDNLTFSRDIAGVFIVWTTINRRHSISGWPPPHRGHIVAGCRAATVCCGQHVLTTREKRSV